MDDVTDETFVTVAEVAARFRVSKMSVYRLVREGDLEAIQVGRLIRIRKASVDAYAERPMAVAP